MLERPTWAVKAALSEARTIAMRIPVAEIVEHADGNLDVLISDDDEETLARLMRQPNGLWHVCMWDRTPEQCCELGKLLAGFTPLAGERKE